MQPESENVEQVVATVDAEERREPAPSEPVSSLEAAEAEIAETLDEAEALPQEPVCPGDLSPLDVPEKLQRAIDIRIGIWEQILKVELKRHEFARTDLAPPTRSECSRQIAQLRNIPAGDEIEAHLQRLQGELERLSNPMARLARGAAADVILRDEATAGEYREALVTGIEQSKLLASRAKLDDVVSRTAAALVEAEPLVQLGARHGCDATDLLAWTFYARGVEQRIAECERLVRQHRDEVEAHRSRTESGGLIGKLRRIGAGAEAAPSLDPRTQERWRAAERELEAIEPFLVERFWSLYEDIAWLYGSGQLCGEDDVVARAYLRYGLVAQHPSLIAREKLDYVLNDCRSNVADWQDALDTTHIVYADEHLRAVACKLTTPGPDEDAEIAGRASRAYKADRVWRQFVGGQVKVELFRQRLAELKREVAALEGKVHSLESRRQKLLNTPSRKLDAEAARIRIAEHRPTLARKQRMFEMLRTKHLPRQIDVVQEAERRAIASDCSLTPEEVVRREGRFIRRLVRLASRLKTPYPHFVLRDRLSPGKPNCHDRSTVENVVQSVEYADRHIFHQTVIAARKIDRQLTLRVPPTILIVPACGATGISIIPRRESESGKVMVPLLGQRREGLEEIVMRALSDFRWDCLVEDAGADWLSTETLCADYANIRWSYRHRNQDIQRRAGINRKQRDRQNWRSHYMLYLESAGDGGRKLFFKCLDIYEVFMRYICLPDGVTRHCRT